MSSPPILVLVVDDEPNICSLTKEFLEMSEDIKVETTCSVMKANDILATKDYDIIISDYQMPHEDGIQFLKVLRNSGNKIPFILFTGKGREDVVIEAMNNGADFYIQKGGDPTSLYTELTYKVRHAVARRRGEVSLQASVEDLKSAASRYEALIAASNTGAWEYHMDSDFMWGSPEYFSMLGRDRNDFDMSGKSNLKQVWISLLHPEDRDRAVNHFMNYLKNPEGIYQQYFRRSHIDGHWVWIWSRGNMLRDASGNPKGIVVGTHIDISERKRIEDELEETQKQLRLAMDMVKLGHWEYDVATDMFTFDDQFYALLGTTAEIEGGTNMRLSEYAKRFLPPEDAPLVEKETAIAIATADPTYSRQSEHDIIRRDGERRRISVIFRVLIGPSGIPIKTYGVNQDITDRRRNEERLQYLVTRYNTILDVIPDIIVEVGMDKKYRWTNPAGFNFFGESLIGREASYYFEGEQDTYDEVQSLFNGNEEVVQLESWQRRQDGERRLLSWVCRVLKDNAGNVTGALSSARDITEQRRKEDAIRASEAHLLTLIHTIPDLIWLKDEDGIYLSCNAAFENLFGAKEEDIVGKTDYDFVEQDLADSFRENDRRAIEKGGPASNEEWITFANDGHRALLHTIKTPMYDDQKKFIGVLGIGHEITDLKQTENALRESEEKFRFISENSPDHIVVHDACLRYVWVLNPQLGLALSDMIGKTDHDLLSRHDADKLTALKREVLTSGRELKISIDLASSGGNREYFDGILKPRRDPSGQIIGIIGYYRNITEIVRAHKALQDINRKLNLLSSITRHDINNQLLILNGYLEMIRLNKIDDRSNELLSKVEATEKRISAMIQFTKEYEEIGVHDAAWHNVRALVSRISKEVQLGKAIIVNDLPDDLEIFSDPMVDKVIHNLIDNAVRHGENVTTIHLFEEQDRDALKIICQDDGVGISADTKPKLFIRDSRTDHGFGLFLSREILAISGITIMENSDDGGGARFEIRVPPGKWRVSGDE